jgi:uncharacterized membrane protein
MNFVSLSLILIALGTFVAGQLVLKRAMELTKLGRNLRETRFVQRLVLGIFLMTISFFITLGLLERFDLSYLYPFQGLSIVIISALAAIVLKERVTLRLAIGVLLVAGGVLLVSLS